MRRTDTSKNEDMGKLYRMNSYKTLLTKAFKTVWPCKRYGRLQVDEDQWQYGWRCKMARKTETQMDKCSEQIVWG